MGIVFRATDLEAVRLERSRCEVALKVLRIDLREMEAALFDEVEKTRRMQQENIVDVYGFEADEASSFMVMELLSGIPLSEFVTRSWPTGMPLRQALPYIEQMGAALSYAHRQGLVHSDFKPSNVMISAESVKVLDFGIARMVRAAEASAQDEALTGVTPIFASCEMLEQRPADKRDDVFCLGLVVYFLLSGRHPFNDLTALDARARRLTVPPIRGLTRKQNTALQQALRFEKRERTSSIEELVEQLQDQRSGEAIMASVLGAAAVLAGIYVWTAEPRDAKQRAAHIPQVSPAPEIPHAEGSTQASATPLPEPLPDDSVSIDSLLARADAALARGAYVDPPGDNAWALYNQVQRLAPHSARAEQGRMETLRALTLQGVLIRAQAALQQKHLDEAQRLTQQAEDLAPYNPAVQQAERALMDAMTARARRAVTANRADNTQRLTEHRNRTVLRIESLFYERLGQGRILDPAADSAKFYLTQLLRSEPNGPGTQVARQAFGQLTLMEAGSAARRHDYSGAARWLSEAAAAGVEQARIASIESDIRVQQRSAVSSVTTMAVASTAPATMPLKQTQYVEPTYPTAAIAGSLTGSVEVQFVVEPDGTTSAVTITGARPAGIFEQAAIDAVRQWRYQPFKGEGRRARITLTFTGRDK